MQITAVYSEAGGVQKSTTSATLATESARAGLRTVLVDLDPRAVLTQWMGATPAKEWQHVGAILGNEDPDGWAKDLAVPVDPDEWAPNLRVVPSHRDVALRESEKADHAEVRLKRSLAGLDADLVIIDCPNRPGGPLVLSALTAADSVLYTASLDRDGIDGVDGATTTVRRFIKNRQALGVAVELRELGIVARFVQVVHSMLKVNQTARAILDQNYPGLMLSPMIPERPIVREARLVGSYHGNYPGARDVIDSYRAIARQIITNYPQEDL